MIPYTEITPCINRELSIIISKQEKVKCMF